ncbi:hypothetical protein ABZV77_11640 [Streptomyces sp. NPDC004732]|uniref:hypothetical protein n=1 Tax=Streptomyces sp. NPDC004732 TaxID=3154290 RepID=UPI0033A89629
MDLIKKNPALISSVVSAVLALLATYIPNLPNEAILGVVAALLAGGVGAQRVEDQKTDEALHEAPPGSLEAEGGQLAILAAENLALQEKLEALSGPQEDTQMFGGPPAEQTSELPPVIDEFSLEDGRALFRS